MPGHLLVRQPIILEVDNPEDVAGRYWDAGYEVRVNEDELGEPVLSVVDPLGRHIELIRASSLSGDAA